LTYRFLLCALPSLGGCIVEYLGCITLARQAHMKSCLLWSLLQPYALPSGPDFRTSEKFSNLLLVSTLFCQKSKRKVYKSVCYIFAFNSIAYCWSTISTVGFNSILSDPLTTSKLGWRYFKVNKIDWNKLMICTVTYLQEKYLFNLPVKTNLKKKRSVVLYLLFNFEKQKVIDFTIRRLSCLQVSVVGKKSI
jgi:hypothetical protein